MIVDAARARSIALTPPELATSLRNYTGPDGTSVFRPSTRHSHRICEEPDSGDRAGAAVRGANQAADRSGRCRGGWEQLWCGFEARDQGLGRVVAQFCDLGIWV